MEERVEEIEVVVEYCNNDEFVRVLEELTEMLYSNFMLKAHWVKKVRLIIWEKDSEVDPVKVTIKVPARWDWDDIREWIQELDKLLSKYMCYATCHPDSICICDY